MKKRNLKSLELKKEVISKIQENSIKGGVLTPGTIQQTQFLCVSQIYDGEDNCISIIKR